jgi:hypothetical protein
MIVDRNPILQQLFGNDWVACAARANPDQPWQRWTRAGWRPWTADRPGDRRADRPESLITDKEEMVP